MKPIYEDYKDFQGFKKGFFFCQLAEHIKTDIKKAGSFKTPGF